MRFAFSKILIISLMATVAGCYYDNEEDLYGTAECSLDSVTYSATVLPILKNNCYKCHDAANNFGGITLEGYDKVKSYAQSGLLLGVIKHQSGFPAMPKNEPKLLDCHIQKIEKWITDGALNN